MRPIQIKRHRNMYSDTMNVDAKQALRAHIDHLAIDQQRLFVELALQLISTRTDSRDSENWVNVRQPWHERKQ